MSYASTTFYDTDDMTAKAVAEWLLKKYTDVPGEELLPGNIHFVYYHTEVKREFLSDILIDIPELNLIAAGIDYLSDTQQAYFATYMIYRNIELIFTRCEDYDTTTAPQYAQMQAGYEKMSAKEYDKVKKYIRKLLGVDTCLSMLK